MLSLLTTYTIQPHPSLQPFIEGYFFCTSGGETISIHGGWPASTESSLCFYLAGRPEHYTPDARESQLNAANGCVVGLLSRWNGSVSFNGIYKTFIIQFKPNGLPALLHIPPALFINTIFSAEDLLGKKAKTFQEALQCADDIYQMASLADNFLLPFIDRQTVCGQKYDAVGFVINELMGRSPVLSVEQYALKSNMSLRNFGRRFKEHIGLSPKFYCRLLRFNQAVNKKMQYPASNWTSIAHELGYFDQAHLVKDFQDFAGSLPSVLPVYNEKFISVQRTAY